MEISFAESSLLQLWSRKAKSEVSVELEDTPKARAEQQKHEKASEGCVWPVGGTIKLRRSLLAGRAVLGRLEPYTISCWHRR